MTSWPNPPARRCIVLAAAAVPLILGGLVCSVLLAQRINRSVSRLGRTARALGEGAAISPEKLPVRDLAFVQDALCSAGEDIAARRLTERALLGDVQRGPRPAAGGGGRVERPDLRPGHRRTAWFWPTRPVPRCSASPAGRMRSAAGWTAWARRVRLPLAAAEPGCVATVDDRVFEVGQSALRNPDGVAIGTISIARDVTERVAAAPGCSGCSPTWRGPAG